MKKRVNVSVVVMGVSGAGKTTLSRALADHFGIAFLEGDSLHPAHNVTKMSAGLPLTDEDRVPWLDAVGSALRDEAAIVVSCSALRRDYRNRLRGAASKSIRFVCLNSSYDQLEPRLRARRNHFMPASLLMSQPMTLELPIGETDALVLDADLSIETLTEQVAAWLDFTSGEVSTNAAARQ